MAFCDLCNELWCFCGKNASVTCSDCCKKAIEAERKQEKERVQNILSSIRVVLYGIPSTPLLEDVENCFYKYYPELENEE